MTWLLPMRVVVIGRFAYWMPTNIDISHSLYMAIVEILKRPKGYITFHKGDIGKELKR